MLFVQTKAPEVFQSSCFVVFHVMFARFKNRCVPSLTSLNLFSRIALTCQKLTYFYYTENPLNAGNTNTRAAISQFGIKTTARFLTKPGLVEWFSFLLPELINNRTAELSRSSGKIQPAVLIKGRHKQLTLHPANCYQACQTPDWDC